MNDEDDGDTFTDQHCLKGIIPQSCSERHLRLHYNVHALDVA